MEELKDMKVQMFLVGSFSTNCYIVSCKDKKEATIIDPAFDRPSEAEETFEAIDRSCLKMKLIVNTHGHPSYNGGNRIVTRALLTWG